jgi:methylmalonyl-CoA/ethylmalonyl-CoA epimerase
MKLHHIGIVVDNIESQGKLYSYLFGLQPLSAVVIDPIQRVRVQFYGDGNSSRFELIEPLGEDSPANRFLEKGGGIYHLCFEVADIWASIKEMRSKGGLLIKGPNPAPAFNERNVAFIIFRDVGIIELVEKPKHEE